MPNDGLLVTLLIKTNSRLLSLCLLLLRWAAGINLFVVGAGKVLGWFGGHGLHLTIESYAKIGFSAPLGYMSTFTEFLGGAALIVGLLTRPAVVAVIINMAVATHVMLPNGYLAGFAHPLILLVGAVIILLAGPMDFSLDALLFRPRRRPVDSSKPAAASPLSVD